MITPQTFEAEVRENARRAHLHRARLVRLCNLQGLTEHVRGSTLSDARGALASLGGLRAAPSTFEAMRVGISTKAMPIGMTVPIGYMRRWNEAYAPVPIYGGLASGPPDEPGEQPVRQSGHRVLLEQQRRDSAQDRREHDGAGTVAAHPNHHVG